MALTYLFLKIKESVQSPTTVSEKTEKKKAEKSSSGFDFGSFFQPAPAAPKPAKAAPAPVPAPKPVQPIVEKKGKYDIDVFTLMTRISPKTC